MWAYLNQAAVLKQSELTVTPVNNGGGAYTLSWTVPSGAYAYQIKYSTKPIVEWLGFDKDTRAYQYDPASYTPFFAASNISNPAPATAGSTQSVTVTGLPTSGVSFAAKWMSGGTPPSMGNKWRVRAVIVE